MYVRTYVSMYVCMFLFMFMCICLRLDGYIHRDLDPAVQLIFQAFAGRHAHSEDGSVGIAMHTIVAL